MTDDRTPSAHQLDLLARPPQYPGWKPDPMSAEAYLANWDLFENGVTTKDVRAPLFRGDKYPDLRRFR